MADTAPSQSTATNASQAPGEQPMQRAGAPSKPRDPADIANEIATQGDCDIIL